MPIIDVAFDYPVTYVPRGARVERTEYASAVMPVMVAEPAPAEAPRILEMDWLVEDGGRVFDIGKAPVVALAVHRFAGSAVRPWNVFSKATRRGVVPESERRADCPGRGDPVRLVALEKERVLADLKPLSEGVLDNARRVVVNGEDEARSYALARAREMCVVDGLLMEPCAEPVWQMQADHSTRESRVDAKLAFGPTSDPVASPAFPIDRLDDALEHAAWMAAQPRRTRFGTRAAQVGSVRLAPGFAAAYDGASDYGRAALVALADYAQGDGFHLLPRDCLLAWVDYRDVLPLVREGDEGAVLAGMEALGRFAAALPEPGDDDTTALTVVRERLPGALRAFARALGRRAVDALDFDESALAGLAFAGR